MLTALATVTTMLAAEAKSGLPQLNPNDFAPQLIWLAITFVALLVLLNKVALPRVGGVIEDRKRRVQRDLDEAQRLKIETEQALADYEASIASARSNATGIARQLREKLSAEVDAERSDVEAQLATRLDDAERQIVEMKQKAMSDVGQIAAETAEAIVVQLTGKSVPPDKVRDTVQGLVGT